MILNILSMNYLSDDIRTRGLYLGSHWLLCKMTFGGCHLDARCAFYTAKISPHAFSETNKKVTWKNHHCPAGPFAWWRENVSRNKPAPSQQAVKLPLNSMRLFCFLCILNRWCPSNLAVRYRWDSATWSQLLQWDSWVAAGPAHTSCLWCWLAGPSGWRGRSTDPTAERLAGSKIGTPLQERGNSLCRIRVRCKAKVQKQEVGGWDFLFTGMVKGWLKQRSQGGFRLAKRERRRTAVGGRSQPSGNRI